MEQQRATVIVTGSSGLIGQDVMRRLADRYELVGFSRSEAPDLPGRHVSVDMSDDESVRDGLREVRERYGARLASVVHLAAYYDFSGAPSPLYREVTVEGTRRLVRGLHDQGFEVGQLLFSSSMLVQRPSEGPGDRIDEGDPLEGAWHYPRSKIETERVLREERDGIPIVLARIAGVYDEWCHSLPIAQQIKRIFERDAQSYLFPGNPEHGSAFIHAADVVDAIELSVERRAELPGELAVLLGEPETLGYDELQDEIGRLLHGDEDWPTIPIPKLVAQAGSWAQGLVGDPFIKPWMIEIADDHYELDLDVARDALGWRARHRLRDTLPAIVENLRRHPVRWYEENKLDPASIPEEARHVASSARG